MNYKNSKLIDNEEQLYFDFDSFQKMVLNDYKLARISREISILGRKEVLNGRAKFGIFGDGKEIPQLAMAKVFKNGDYRSGYYRDQTFMIAIGVLTVKNFFSQLYAHSDLKEEPVSSGRMMTSHFGTRFLNKDGNWKNNLIQQKNSSADVSSTAAQMPRLLGLAQASTIYKKLKNLKKTHKMFSHNGNEVAFGTIGNASISEGLFWETLNAASVLQIPIILSIWDDEYGISVPNKYQFSKKNISDLLYGFHRNKKEKGIEIIRVNGANYIDLIKTYFKADKIARNEHVPVIIHVACLTQPQGHSTSSSHERYKSKKRLEWEMNNDGINKFRDWILNFKFQINQKNNRKIVDNVCILDKIDIEAKDYVRNEKEKAWKAFQKSINKIKNEVFSILDQIQNNHEEEKWIKKYIRELHYTNKSYPTKKSIFCIARKVFCLLSEKKSNSKDFFKKWLNKKYHEEQKNYSSHLYSLSEKASVRITEVFPIYNNNDTKKVDGRIILRENFDKLLELHPDLLIFGEDVGKIGDVNQGLEGLQKKYGKIRVFDTGIRESTILGQGIGLAMRGLRPIVEIQYIDYVLYALQIMSDDLACLQYRTKGGQKAPVIIRTRGHRLEGIWHSGSPMGGIINYLRGILVLVPRNMVKAAGFYNTLLHGDDPALVVECLNGYRIKEKLPKNLGLFRTPIGIVEKTRTGKDITMITYGSTWRIVNEAAEELSNINNIDSEIIDIQSLLPFDIQKDIVKSLQKTNRLLIIDEDVPGGASAYILQKILEEQNGYYYLDSPPVTITAQEHRPPYGSDGDYFSKPSVENIVEKVLKIMHDS
ncbi:alpha-ketoacid dehydrogenase subunit alpha/beta [Blattabacterium cuenoti]|uniref:3-methyl-2-oxobutanoate dehydrogenase (2-methylpropanoyl-transferring) n=1 Tax=Blattabacterium cuenoti STAT TaxID=1457030 RepID=A0A224AB83_9FLAO|nr:thiamine pyrophosphate-dependent enzyme [Blattabacterium cuenoti]BBA17126.1 bifunctional transketolase/2-oxoacid (pyruvate/branched-chain alpha-keto acid) dehydrogenase E1 component [Blattabacterium cuenoti STAT]